MKATIINKVGCKLTGEWKQSELNKALKLSWKIKEEGDTDDKMS